MRPTRREWTGGVSGAVRVLMTVAACALMGLVAPARAQTNAAPTAEAPGGPEAKPGEALADRQAIIADRVKRLEDRMFQLAQALKKTDPEKAQRLVEGLAALREDGLTDHINDVVRMLKEKRLADATDEQVLVEAQMQLILKLLMEETNDLDKQREELKRLEEIRKELKQLLSDQKRAKESAERQDAQKRLADALEDAATTARDLLNRQEGLNADSGSGGDNAARPADAQAAVRGETEALAREVAALADQLRALSEAQKASEASASKDEPTSDPKDKTPGADGASPSPGGGESGDSGSESAPSDQGTAEAAERAAEAKENLDDAADAMRQAEQSLRAAEKAGAEENQAAAGEELRKAVEKLQAKADEIRRTLRLEEEAEKQRKLAEDTEKLLDGMRGDKGAESEAEAPSADKGDKGEESQEGESSPGGGETPSGEGSQSGEQQNGGGQQSPPASPGERPLEEAIPHQQEAAKKLEDNLPVEAIEEQKKAIEKLEQAKEDLEERLDQLRREQQEQLLAALESRFRAMLSRQLEVNKATNRLIELGVDQWKRSDQLELAELSEKQRWVGDEADEAMFLLTEEGSTVVLPPLLQEVRDDARDVADRLAAAQADATTRMLQEELEAILRDMIDAVKKQQEELEQGGGGGGGSDGNPPLLPGSAELKLLRSCQLRINKATESMHDRIDSGADDAASIQSAIEHLSIKQDKVAEMAKSMHESLQKAQ
ncbi:MAG TPA: hypothetical protein P5081_06390 [Phycisphaerae bacterium]|nr:hypothetical protein [Phycisphaerae bacterium]